MENQMTNWKIFLKGGSMIKMNYRDIAKLASNVDPKDLMVYGINVGRYTNPPTTGPWTPVSLSIEVTYWCNRRCVGCYVPDEIKRDKQVIDQDLLESIVDQANRLKIPFVGFAGGEPLSSVSRPGIFKALEQHKLNPFFVYTNGDFVKNALPEIKSHHNLAYMVSLDGLKEEHDKVRGKGSFDKVTSAFQELGAARKLYGASVTVRKPSYHAIGSTNFFKYLAENGVRFVRIRTLKCLKEEINESATQEIMDRTKDYSEKYGVLLSWGGLEDKKSNLPSRDLLVGIDGTVRSTRFALEESWGNLKTRTLKQVIADIRSCK